VAHHLGNTPAVARASYIDPRVFDRYRDGVVVAVHDLADDPSATAIQGDIENAVLELVGGSKRAPGLDRVDRLAA
jgi:DNA topoisomerase-1